MDAQQTAPERNHLMGDTKGKKEKAKGKKQHDAKQKKAEKQKQDKNQPKTA
jgi:hypothetical protein